LNAAESTSPLHVLVVDDEADIRDLVRAYLERQSIRVSEAASEAELSAQLSDVTIQVILLDINLGNEDGFAIARRLRGRWHGGLLMVTGRADMVDRVVGLEIGADDYVTKPFDLRELLARVRSVARRTSITDTAAQNQADSTPARRVVSFDRFQLDLDRRELRDANQNAISLTTGEFELLHALAQHPGIVLSRDQLLQKTHNRDAAPFDRTIDVQIGRLRKKLGDTGSSPALIKSIRGVGYMLVVAPRV
jgi:two-component system, OmpR family, response regulator